jgi:ABC-type nitrate/sulfonate/bicarbonate transport system substrate-binding protein
LKVNLGKRRAITLIVTVVAVALILSSFFYLNSLNTYAGKVENVSFGTFFGSSEPYAALLYVAQDKHFLEQNGLNLTLKDYTSATNALNGALNGEVNFAISSEYAFVATNVLRQGNLKIIATIDKSQTVSIVGRRDKGIENISDLQGKRIGLTLNVAPQFYLATFLKLNKIDTQTVSLVNVPTTEYVNSIVNGTVDAVVVSQSTIVQIEDKLPNNTVVWSIQNNQLTNMVVSCRNDWIIQHPDIVTRFLNSLAQAEAYVVNHPAETRTIVQKRLNTTNIETTRLWSNHQFSLSLDQSLIAAMENEARWIITNNLTNQTFLPDFLNYVYLKGLSSVKPESVNVVNWGQ